MGDEEEEQEKQYELYCGPSNEKRQNGSQQYTGMGKAIFLNDDTYDGTFVEGLRRGRGVYTWKKTGDCYEGFYEENKKHGFGRMTYTSKSGAGEEEEAEEGEEAKGREGSFVGYFAAGKRGCRATDAAGECEKDGTFTYHNGDMYVGEWCDGKKHGKGTYTYAKDSTKLVGEWVAGKIVSGKWIFPNGVYYTGRFQFNKPNGKGVWIFPNGNQLTGEYAQKAVYDEEAGGGGEEEGEDAVKPEPKEVFCSFKPGQSTSVRSASMSYSKFGA